MVSWKQILTHGVTPKLFFLILNIHKRGWGSWYTAICCTEITTNALTNSWHRVSLRHMKLKKTTHTLQPRKNTSLPKTLLHKILSSKLDWLGQYFVNFPYFSSVNPLIIIYYLLLILPSGNLFVRVYAIRISDGCRLGRLSNRGQILRGENVPQWIYSLHRDGTVHREPK